MADVLNTIYQGDFCNKSGEDIIIELKQRMSDADPVPEIIPIIFAGENNQPAVIEYSDKGDLKSVPIYGCGCTLNIKAIGDFELSSLYTADEREWQIVISGAWKFSGWLIPDSCSEPYASKPYDVSVKGTDAIGTLESVPFLQSDGTKYKGFIKDIDVLRFALAKTGLELGFNIGVNTFEDSMDTGLCPLSQAYINVDAFIDTDGNAFSCLEVIRSISERWFAQLRQFDGRWQLINILEKSKGPVNSWNFDSAGVVEASSTIGNTVNAGGITEDLQPVGNVSFAKALASSTAYYRYGYPANQLLNGNMDTWTSKPSGLPDGWITNGAAVAHTEIRLDENGNPTNDYYIVIDSSGSSGSITNNNGVLVRAQETTTVSFDMLVPTAPGGASLIFLYLGVLIYDGAGNFFTNNNGWQPGFQFYVIQYRSGDFDGQVSVNFKVNARDSDYTLYFGVQSLQEAGPADYPTSINNVNITPSVTADQTKPPVGMYNRQKSLASQTYTKDPILLLHSDETNAKRTSQISIGLPPPIEPSDKWARAGITESESLLHIIANSELITHSQPYRILEADFKGFGQVDPNTLLSVEFLPGDYIFLSGSFDLKKDVRSLRFAQVLTEDIPYTEEIKEDYGTEKDKNGVSVGTPAGVNAPSSGGASIDLTGYALITDVPVKADATETANGTNDDKFITPFKLLGWWTNIKTLAATISGLWNFTTRPTYNGSNLITLADVPAESDTLATVTARGNITTGPITVNGKATITGAPTTANDALRLTDLGTGWAIYSDNAYTVGSPFIISASATSNIPNNAAVIINNQIPFGVTALYSGGKITPQNDGDSYLVNVRFTAISSSNTGLADVSLDIGGALGIINEQTISLRKGAGSSQRINIVFDVYSGSTFLANGGTLKIHSLDGDTSIYNIQYKITRTHKAK